jgi:hypothetical protein
MLQELKYFLGSSTGNMLVDNEAYEKYFQYILLIAVHCEDETTIQFSKIYG